MKGRFKTPIWVIPVLAMVVALGAFAVLAGISKFSAQPAEASIQEGGQGLSSTVNVEKLTEPLQTPLNATQQVTGTGTIKPVQNTPQRPGAPSSYTIRFTTGSQLNVGQEITLLFAKEFQFPSVIDRNQVSMSASSTVGTCAISDEVAPSDVTIDFVLEDAAQPEVKLRVPDMNPTDQCPGAHHIAANSNVTIIFRQGAGIRNPAEGNAGRRVEIRTDTDPTPPLIDTVPVPWTIELSNANRSRNQSLTVTGYGFRGVTTFWRDANADRVMDQPAETGPTGVCQTTAADFVATCTFTVQNPPFAPGFTAPGGNCTVGTASGCNYINAQDSRGNTVNLALFANAQQRLDNSTLELRGSVTVSPASGRAGDTLTVQLRDFPPNQNLTQLDISGVPVTNPTPGSVNTGTTGSVNFTMRIPNQVPQGVQELQVRSNPGAPAIDSTTRRANLTIGGASLSLSHEQVIPNQKLTISGSGFTQRAGLPDVVCVLNGGITLADVPLQIDDTLTANCGGTGQAGIVIASGGTFTMTVRIHDLGSQIPIALATPGTHELRVLDSQGAQGALMVTIPERTLEVTPAAARPRDIVTIIGRSFIADEPDSTFTARVDITYDCGGGNERRVSATPDVSGNFRETLRIPSQCAIPSTNTIRVEMTGVDTDTVTHEIPDALVRVEPVRGPAGTTVQVVGEGFRTFESVDRVRFGGLNALGGRTANTDDRGNFTIPDIVVPGLDPGIHAVIIDVGETTASTSYEVLPVGVVGIPSDVIPAMEPLGDNMVRVFHFNNVTKVWQFYDPRPEFADANTLNELIEGEPYWVRVTQDQQVELNARPRNLTCVNPGTPQEDCWNLIVW